MRATRTFTTALVAECECCARQAMVDLLGPLLLLRLDMPRARFLSGISILASRPGTPSGRIARHGSRAALVGLFDLEHLTIMARSHFSLVNTPSPQGHQSSGTLASVKRLPSAVTFARRLIFSETVLSASAFFRFRL
jgi:hypothetical protein